MSHQPPPEEPLVGEVRFRVPLPIVIPFLSLLLIAALAIGFGSVLLSVPSEAATVIATVTAINIMGACAFIALRSKVASTSYMELLAIVMYPVLIGVVIANVGIGESSHGEGSGGGGGESPPPPTNGLVVSAANVAFDTTEITLAAGKAQALEFNNEDTLEHNISVYEDDSAAKDLFTGEIIPGGSSTTYDIEIPDPGEFYFQCDVHPNMNGAVTAE